MLTVLIVVAVMAAYASIVAFAAGRIQRRLLSEGSRRDWYDDPENFFGALLWFGPLLIKPFKIFYRLGEREPKALPKIPKAKALE
jgi:hypothetical protein